MDNSLLMWVGFNVFVIIMLAIDLGIFHRHAHHVSSKEALSWSVVWIVLAMCFNACIYYFWRDLSPDSVYTNAEAATAFLTGYIIEKSLSVDNIFVFVLIFGYFAVPKQYQHRVLFWGILGALIMRGIMIWLGAALITEFHWVIYIFGGFLILSGIKMALQKETHIEPEKNPLVRLFKKFMPVSNEYDGQKFFTFKNGVKMATPLFVTLLIVEFTDLVFAVDSIPAIFAVTKDPFIVYTSNVFAILGLRSLYFLLANAVHKFTYLKLGLSVILVFVGFKLLLTESAFEISTELSLGVVAGVLIISMAASVIKNRIDDKKQIGAS